MAMSPEDALETINDPEELRAAICTLVREEVDIQMTLRDRERCLEAAALEVDSVNDNIAVLNAGVLQLHEDVLQLHEDVRLIHDKYCHHGIRLNIHHKSFHNPSVEINQSEVFFCLPGHRGYDERSR